MQLTAQGGRLAIKVESVRGIYAPGALGWELQPPNMNAGRWMRQDLLPHTFKVDDAGCLRLSTSDGSEDWRFAPGISMAHVHDRVARGHAAMLVRGHLSMGTVYIYARNATERWMELVTLPTDVNEPASTERRICDLMSNGDVVQAREYGSTLKRHLFPFTPSTLFPVASWLA
jgi:hypothetical protein